MKNIKYTYRGSLTLGGNRVDQITAKELEQKIKADKKVHIIDVREAFEVAEGKIPGAKHIPLGDIPGRLNELDKSEHYYIICQSGGRSANACEFLRYHGYQVTNVAGGMMSWQGAVK